ncbi:glycosyltransferase family 39 protein [Actinomadura xylanilytica]|uniref:glycosyltransferase family 39 protein n=1 Tax=Actinomadura xylanilytica TaxID=887459 RepID=UPI00255AF044|nr:glycosyltransferase family 39 protein [Actinomadura xylanilytica]MDL4773224.1 glycosyltransferase family 39 protein [Actinomadura xylanilytica]
MNTQSGPEPRDEPHSRTGREPGDAAAVAGDDARAPDGRGRRWAVVGVPALVALLLGLWGTGRPSLWADELATVDVARRSVPQILHLLRHVDAVHGAYYLLMHWFVDVAGFSSTAVRLPSVAATVVAAGVLAALGRSLAGPPAGLLAGLVFACTPVVSQYALEARSYALVTCAAVLATYAFVRALRSGGIVWFAVYGVLLVAVGALQIFGFLLVAAHLVTVVAVRRTWRVRLAWLVSVVVAGLLLVPLAWVASGQRSAVEWIPDPDVAHLWASVWGVTGSVAAVVLMGALCAVALVRARAGELVRVTVPWAVVPPAALLAASLAEPVFVARYLLFCVPAVALLVGAGLTVRPRLVMVPVGLALLVVTAVVQPTLRRPDSKWHDVTPIVRVLKDEARPGDAFLVAPSGMRSLSSAYPQVFAGLLDIAQRSTGAHDGTLHGREVGGKELARRLRNADRVWVVRRINGNRRVVALMRKRVAMVRKAGLRHRVGRWTAKRMRLTLYVRPDSTDTSGDTSADFSKPHGIGK